MNLTIARILQTPRSTTGNLLIDGVHSFVVLEPPKRPNPPPDGNGFVCIDAGVYPLTIRWSDKFQRPMPHVEGVPGRTAVELHPGNFPRDSEACGLIGLDFGDQPDYVSHSVVSFASLMSILYEGATLTNPNDPEPQKLWDVGTIQYIDPQGVTQ